MNEATEGRFKWGDSKSISDQAIECMAALDKWFERYTNSEAFKAALEYGSDDDREMINEGFIIMKHIEEWAITWTEQNERIERKLDKIYKMVEEIDLK